MTNQNSGQVAGAFGGSICAGLDRRTQDAGIIGTAFCAVFLGRPLVVHADEHLLIVIRAFDGIVCTDVGGV